MSKIHTKSVIAAVSGHVIERYDIALYGYFSVLLTPIFFQPNAEKSVLASLAVFAAGYVMRPLGGLFFGYIGDKYGRKKSFSLSVVIMIFPTLIIGLLPSYQTIGMMASAIVLLCRLVQGLCSGGEFGGAGIFVNEHLRKDQIGFSGGLIASTGLLGGVLGTFLGAITITLLPSWGWRLPFILGAVLTFYSYLARRQMLETPVFKKALDSQVYKGSFVNLVKNNIRNMFGLMVIGGCGHMQLYLILIYMNVIYTQKCNLTSITTMWINTAMLCIWVVLAPLMGLLADRIGIKRVMITSASLMIIFSYPLFKFLVNDNLYDVQHVIIAQACLSVIGVGFTSCISSLFTLLFPVTERYRCSAFSVTLGQAMLGGTAPLLATYLVKELNNPYVPVIQLCIGSIMGISALLWVKYKGE